MLSLQCPGIWSLVEQQHIKKQRHYFTDKDLYRFKWRVDQSYAFSSSHVWMWELYHKESWALKSWCFWTVVLEKTLESPLDCKELQPVNPKGNQSWIFIGRIDAVAETPILGPPDAKNWLIRKDPDAGNYWRQEKGMIRGWGVGWHHWLNGYEFEQAPGVGDGRGSLACCVQSMGSQRVRRDSATELNWATKILQDVLAAKKKNVETVLNECTKIGWKKKSVEVFDIICSPPKHTRPCMLDMFGSVCLSFQNHS